eukprot:CAMPEP_0204147794 /NCGR_PEP_ID=MMETSP0361-20130328/23046_1 /ASSEMBLY_ACC=CAM_ASM_000343 /TAXON_ID=268821 /ORGANISM="Scrippsiella Hangoei, Strain SHTV-5" /LENGTH=95 /DNA_ID=CAMNT_0051102051 /DNA_START=24 /DNA_END=307 /DNA_ORIENTATION=+
MVSLVSGLPAGPGGAAEGRRRWPDVLVRWETPEAPMKGTPPNPFEAEKGSIKSLRLTETDKRKRSAAQKQQKEAASKVAGEKASSVGSSSNRSTA